MPDSFTSTVGKWYGLFLIVLPTSAFLLTGVPFDVREGTLAAFTLGCALCALAVLSLFRKLEFYVPTSPLVLTGLPLLVVSIISLAQVSSFNIAVWGLGFEMGTVGSIFLFATTIVAGAVIAQKTFLIKSFLILTITVSLIGAAIVFFSPNSWAKSISDIWPQLSFLSTAALCVCVVLSDYRKGGTLFSSYSIYAIILTVTSVLFFQTEAVLLSIISVALISSFYYFFDRSAHPTFPIFSSVVVALLALLLFFGMRGPILQLSPDIRPPLVATELIMDPMYLDSLPNALVGRGANTFSRIWSLYRTAQFNTAFQWDIAPQNAYSAALTFATELGALGFFAFLFCPLALLYVVSEKKNVSRREISTGISSRTFAGAFTLTLFLFAASLIYPVGVGLFLLAGLGLGICAGLLSEDAAIFAPRFFGRIVSLVLFALGGLFLLWISGHQFAAALYHARGVSLQATSLSGSAKGYEWAAQLWPISTYQIDASKADLRFAFTSADNGGAPDQDSAKSAIERAKNFSDQSVQDSYSFEARLGRASLHVSLAGAGIPDSTETASSSLVIARGLAPTRPESFFLSAILATIEKRPDVARTFLTQALALKPDYEDAQKLLAQLDAAR